MIRRATAADVPALTRVRTSVRENHLSVTEMAQRGITEASVMRDLASGDLVAWVALAGGEVAAFAMVRPGDATLFALFTHPQHEGKGYASALLQLCEDLLRAHGCAHVSLDTGAGTRAIGFYERRGYTITAITGTDVHMRKDLSASPP